MQTSRITKIAGLSLAGFVAASIVADRVNLQPIVSQIAGFAGAFVGTLVGRRRKIPRDRIGSHKRERPRGLENKS